MNSLRSLLAIFSTMVVGYFLTFQNPGDTMSGCRSSREHKLTISSVSPQFSRAFKSETMEEIFSIFAKRFDETRYFSLPKPLALFNRSQDSLWPVAIVAIKSIDSIYLYSRNLRL